MKREIVALLCIGAMILGGCAQAPRKQAEAGASPEVQSGAAPTESAQPIATSPEAGNTPLDDSNYIGEYSDHDNNEPSLEIAKGDDGKYMIQIGIFRLTSLSDGVGELTAEGINFTATDGAGNPISGVITVDGETATVTFTDSTWSLLEAGSAFQYHKTSDTPNISQ